MFIEFTLACTYDLSSCYNHYLCNPSLKHLTHSQNKVNRFIFFYSFTATRECLCFSATFEHLFTRQRAVKFIVSILKKHLVFLNKFQGFTSKKFEKNFSIEKKGWKFYSEESFVLSLEKLFFWRLIWECFFAAYIPLLALLRK